jgi:hypothetical protein
MLTRLGIVIYWLGWIIAGIVVFFGLLLLQDPGVNVAGVLVGSLILAFVVWLIGYAFRYILGGPKAAARQPSSAPTLYEPMPAEDEKMLRESFVAGATNTGNVTATVGNKLVLNWHGTPTQRDGVLQMFPVIRDKAMPGLELGSFADAAIASIHDDGMSPDNDGSNMQTIAMLWRVFTTRLDDDSTYGDLVAHANMHAAFELHEQPNDQFKVTWKISVMRGEMAPDEFEGVPVSRLIDTRHELTALIKQNLYGRGSKSEGQAALIARNRLDDSVFRMTDDMLVKGKSADLAPLKRAIILETFGELLEILDDYSRRLGQGGTAIKQGMLTILSDPDVFGRFSAGQQTEIKAIAGGSSLFAKRKFDQLYLSIRKEAGRYM